MQSSLRNSWLPAGLWWLYKRWFCTKEVHSSHLLTACQQDGGLHGGLENGIFPPKAHQQGGCCAPCARMLQTPPSAIMGDVAAASHTHKARCDCAPKVMAVLWLHRPDPWFLAVWRDWASFWYISFPSPLELCLQGNIQWDQLHSLPCSLGSPALQHTSRRWICHL